METTNATYTAEEYAAKVLSVAEAYLAKWSELLDDDAVNVLNACNAEVARRSARALTLRHESEGAFLRACFDVDVVRKCAQLVEERYL